MDNLDPDRRSETCGVYPAKTQHQNLLSGNLCDHWAIAVIVFTGKDLPGKPDIAWIGRKRAIFVHGCFWHGHNCKEGLRKPKSRVDYWLPKIENNKTRDAEHIKTLKADGWKIITIWECELKNMERVEKRLKKLLDT